jgi:hypothetical protein
MKNIIKLKEVMSFNECQYLLKMNPWQYDNKILYKRRKRLKNKYFYLIIERGHNHCTKN